MLCLFVACTPAPGRVDVVFTWPGAPPAQGWIFVNVQERAPESQPRLLASARAPVGDNVALSLPTVPNGDHRVVVAEVRDGESLEGSRVLYRGISSPFTVAPGVVSRAEVALELERVPDLLAFTIAEANALGYVRSATVTFELLTGRADFVQIAFDAEFGSVVIEASTRDHVARTSSAGDELRIAYQLDGTDGAKTFFARVVDRAGYRSDVLRTEVTLDRVPPAVDPRTVQVVLLAEEANLVRSQTGTVSAATVGTTVQLTFRVTEPLAATPKVTTDRSPGLSLAPLEPDGDAYAFELTLSATNAPHGTHIPVVQLEDRAGWVATHLLSARIEVDTAPEPPPTSDGLMLLRAPWGMSATGLLPSTLVQAQAESCQSGLTLAVYDIEDSTQRRLLGQGRVAADGSARIPLAFGDRTTAWVACVDEAGNVSESSEIRRGAWTATLVGRVPGESVANPHVATVTERAGVSLLSPSDAVSEPSSEPLVAPDGDVLDVDAAIGWSVHRGQTATRPAKREAAALAYDPIGGNLLLIGGSVVDAALWSWDGAVWSDVTPAGLSFNALSSPGFVYDGRTGGLVAFAGSGMGEQTWLLDKQWRLITNTGPVFLDGQSFAYDPLRGEIVLFGGIRGDNALHDETWIFRDDTWTQQALPMSPPRRAASTLVWDTARDVAVLHGGRGNEPGALETLSDTWLWDGTAWREVALTGATPGRRECHSMAYDPVRDRVVLVGGFDRQTSTYLPDVWEWDGTAWGEVTIAGPTPGLRCGASIAFDAKTNEVVLFGGRNPASAGAPANRTNDLWSFNGTRWRRLDDEPTPSARASSTATYVESTGEVMMCCGIDAIDARALDDVWHWNGRSWRRAAASLPMGLSDHSMTYDAARDRVVVFSGTASEDYEWDGSVWRTITTSVAPPRRARPVLAYHPPSRQTVLFAGRTATIGSSDTWTYDGLMWTQRVEDGTSEGRRRGGTAAYDTDRGVVVVYGGFAFVADWWIDVLEWGGTAWQQVLPSGTTPGPRTGHAMAYDPIRQRTMLFGGTSDSGASDELWAWDGARWEQVDVRGPKPPAMTGHSMAFHAPTGTLVVQGGLRTGDPFDTWSYPALVGTHAQPALTLDVDWASAGVRPQAIMALHIDAVAGGTGRTSTATPAIDGVVLQAWDAWAGRWEAWATANGGAQAPARFAHTESTSDLARYLTNDRRLHIRLMPRGALTGESQSPRLAVDHLEVQMEYVDP